MKPIICLDFDGIFNEYSGYDGDNIGQPRPGIELFLKKLNTRYRVWICSVRRYSKIQVWLEEHNLLQYVEFVTSYKPPAVAYVDDRAIRIQIEAEEMKPKPDLVALKNLRKEEKRCLKNII